MKKYVNTNTFRLLLLILAIGLVIEIIMFVSPFAVFFAGLFIFIGLKLRPHLVGTVLLVIGFFILAGIIFKLKILKFAIILLLAFLFYHYYWKTKSEPQHIRVKTSIGTNQEKTIIKKQPFILNAIFGGQKLGDRVYEMDNINIQTGFGDTVIDLSMTMLPPGETVIVIRGFVGNIQLLVPYDVTAHVDHSVILGQMSIFTEKDGGFNKNLMYYPSDYHQATRKLKVFTSIVIGDIEVKNI